MSDDQIEQIAKNVEIICEGMGRALSVEEIQDLVENEIMNQKAYRLATNYITYRYKRALVRKSNSTDKQILSLLECNNEEVHPGELQQEPDGQQRPERLHGRRGKQGHYPPFPAPAAYRGRPRTGI